MKLLLLLFALVPVTVSACDGETLLADAGEGEVTFTVTQGGAPFSGRFAEFGATICREAGQVTQIDAWLAPASVDSGLPEVDELLVGPEFFRVSEHPRATFASSDIEMENSMLQVSGMLEINGIPRRQDVRFRFVESADGWRADGEFTISRLAYDLGSGEWENTDYLADEVRVTFDVVLRPASDEEPQ